MTARAGLRTVDSEIIALAEDESTAAAEAAGVVVRELHTAAEAAEASLLLDEVWNVDKTGTNILEPGLIVAFAHAGNYVSAAYSADDPDEMIGVTIWVQMSLIPDPRRLAESAADAGRAPADDGAGRLYSVPERIGEFPCDAS